MGYRILVADDEYYARKALVMMLEQMGLPIEVTDVEDGQEAVDYLGRNPVDIVVTDIKMPALDGIGVAAYVRDHFPETDVVIETGYEDFQYAIKAIRYGVKEYLTKPINAEELSACIRKLVEERRGIQEKGKEQLLENILASLDFDQVMEMKELRERFVEPEIREASSSFLMISGEMSEACFRRWKEQPEIRDLFSGNSSWYFRGKKEYVGILKVQDSFVIRRKDLEKGRLARLRDLLDQQSYLGISGVHKGAGELKKARRECTYAVNERIISGEHLLVWDENIEVKNLLSKEKEEFFFHAISRGKLADAEKIVDGLFDDCLTSGESIYSLYNGIIKLFTGLRRAYYQKIEEQASTGNYFLFDFKVDLYQFHELGELRQYVKMILREVCEEEGETENHELIDDLLAYLEMHYANDITLNELAEHKYFVSAGHLSRLFKAKTGMNFSKYLMGIRMQKAAEYLENTEFEITDIASFTGYNDASHFTQNFRKFFGMTPTEFRARKRGQKSHRELEKKL